MENNKAIRRGIKMQGGDTLNGNEVPRDTNRQVSRRNCIINH